MIEPTGQATTAPETTTAADDSQADVTERKLSESEVNARFAQMRKQTAAEKKRAAELEARLAELSAKLEEKDTEKLSETERLEKRLRKLEEDKAREVKEWQTKAETERQRRHSTLVRNALLEEIGKRGLYEPDLVAEILSNTMAVTDDDRVVRVKDDVEADVKTVLDEFCKARPRFVPAAASGSGSRSGAPKTGRKAPGELTGVDLERAAEAELLAMRRTGNSL